MLKTIARTLVSYSAALTTSAYFRERVGNLSIMPKDCVGKTTDELVVMLTEKAKGERARMETALLTKEIEKYTRQVASAIEQSLDQDNDDWRVLVPGKQVLSLFAGKAGTGFYAVMRRPPKLSRGCSVSASRCGPQE